MDNKGFTLVEMLIVLLFIPIIISLTLALMSLIKKELPLIINQEDIFLLQIKQLLQRSHNIKYEDNAITFTYNLKEFEISHHQNRLVKRPGYEILLMNVISIQNNGECFLIKTDSRDLCIEK